MRLIDADALIEEIARIPDLRTLSTKTIGKAINKMANIDPQPHWIPCSEMLPPAAQRVLLSGHGEVMVGMLHSFGKYSLEPTGISYIYPKNDIEAWMPLPEPYQEGADE